MAQINAAADRDYADFEPAFEWIQEEARDTLIVKLPGFRRNQLRVQVTSAPLLRISGERQINLNTFTRFNKEFPLSASHDANRITAKFEADQLYINLPKSVPQATPQEAKGDELNSQKAPTRKEKEQPSDQAAEDAQKKKVRTDGPVETVEASGTPSKPINEQTDVRGAAKIVGRLKTHLLDLSETIRLSGGADEYRSGGAEDHKDKKELAATDGRQSNKMKLLNLFVAILMLVVLGLYVKNAFKSSSVGSKFQEL